MCYFFIALKLTLKREKRPIFSSDEHILGDDKITLSTDIHRRTNTSTTHRQHENRDVKDDEWQTEYTRTEKETFKCQCNFIGWEKNSVPNSLPNRWILLRKMTIKNELRESLEEISSKKFWCKNSEKYWTTWTQKNWHETKHETKHKTWHGKNTGKRGTHLFRKRKI